MNGENRIKSRLKIVWGDYLKYVRYKIEDENTYHPDNMLPNGVINEDLQ